MQNIFNGDLMNTASLAQTGSSEPLELDNASLASLQIIGGANASAKTFDSGVAAVTEATFQALASTDAGDFIIVHAEDGTPYAIAADITGSDPEPTASEWTDIPAAQKAQVDLSGETTDVEVAAAFEVAFDALTGFTAKVLTDDSAADGTMLFTQVVRGPTDAAEVFNEDGSGDGSIVVVETVPGVASEVNIDDNQVTIPSHGYGLGALGRLTTTGTLPGGLALATDYFIIPVDTNTVKFATSLVNANAGTAVNITNQGVGVATFTLTTMSISAQPQICNFGSSAGGGAIDETAWVAEGSPIVITGATNQMVKLPDVGYLRARVKFTVTAGGGSMVVQGCSKG